MADKRTVKIDDKLVEVDPNLTIIQACEIAGIEIPRFCYHERLSIAGNCRMCLVEVVGGPPKPTASCAMQIKDLRPGPDGAPTEIRTNSPMVRKAREGVMEFLLINHPLDCPICDQGGECDLQDQAMAYGVDFSRYREPKRALPDLDIGPLISTTMTRCIYCTRCVRFTTEVAGLDEMGTLGRGEDTRVTTYGNEMLPIDGAEPGDAVRAALRASMASNLQGNIVDLCPVGALTNKPYAFTARPWELTKTESIDVMDALGSSIRVDAKGREVMRILPRNHDGVNEEWISDATRHAVDGLRRQRLDKPYIRENGKLRAATWPEALEAAAAAIKGRRVAGLIGELAPVEAVFALKQLVEGQGGTVECRLDGAKLPAGDRAGYAGTARIADLSDAKFIQIIGANPRNEAPVLNARIRGAWLHGARIGLIGPKADLTYEYAHVGADRADLAGLSSAPITDETRAAPSVVVLGAGALTGEDGAAVLAHARALAENSQSGLLVLHTAASRVGAMDVGAVTEGGLPAALDGAEVIFNLGADEIDMPEGAFVIYQGSHGDRGAHRADVILPAACYTEEDGLFVNTEGRPQLAFRAGFPPGQAKENWAILRALSAELGATQPWDSLTALRRALVEAVPHLAEIGEVAANPAPAAADSLPALGSGALPVSPLIFYQSNPILRASPLMAELWDIATGQGNTPADAAE